MLAEYPLGYSYLFLKGAYQLMNATEISTLYHVNPVVSELNHVRGFDPLHYVRVDKGGLTLDLPYKKLWFRLKYPNGIIRPMLVKMTDQFAIIEARVFFDRRDTQPAASVIARCSRDDISGGDYVRAAQNSAVDQALSDAGFGVQFVPAAPEEATCKTVVREEASTAAVAPKATKKLSQSKSVTESEPEKNAPEPVAEMQEQPAPESAASPAPQTEPVESAKVSPDKEPEESHPAAAYTSDMPVDEICSLMSLEEAENYVVREGTCSGWTIAQVADRRPASLKFYTNGYSGKDNVLRAAAKIVLQKAA